MFHLNRNHLILKSAVISTRHSLNLPFSPTAEISLSARHKSIIVEANVGAKQMRWNLAGGNNDFGWDRCFWKRRLVLGPNRLKLGISLGEVAPMGLMFG